MKAAKYIAAAMIVATALGVATPAFASDEKVPVVGVDASNVGVTIRMAEEGEEEFILKTVPEEYTFTTPINYDGKYEITASSAAQMVAFKNFESGDEDKFTVSASVSQLKLNEEADLIDVDGFYINGNSIGESTGEGTILYGDTDFVKNIERTNDYAIDITNAKIDFTKEGLQLTDTLSGTVLYTQSAVEIPS